MELLQTTLCYLEKDGAYLMLHRVKKKNDVNHDKWVGVGGKFEPGEDALACALREVREETGLCADPARARLVMQVTRPDAFVDIYELVHDFELSDVVLLPGETVDARLVSGEEILRLHETGQFVPHDYLPGLMYRLMGVKRQA